MSSAKIGPEHQTLMRFLDFAVPVEMLQLRAEPSVVLQAMIHDIPRDFAGRGDNAMFLTKRTAETTSHLVRALACLALLHPGGVDFAGCHWCRDHTECHAAAQGVAL